jgi:SAM-dependent methyltransferase
MEAAEYDRLAAVEDRLWYYRALHARVIDALATAALPYGAPVLDAGCGTGGMLRQLSAWRRDLRLEGLDLSPMACERVDAAGYPARQGSIEDMPFADLQFAAIVSLDVVTQIEMPLLAFLEFARCLRPGGMLVVNCAALQWLWSYHDERVQSVRRLNAGMLRELAGEANLAIEFCSYWNFLLLPLVVLRRKVFPRRDGRSDVELPVAPVNAALGLVASAERALSRARVPLPVGSSAFLVARKPVERPRIRLE